MAAHTIQALIEQQMRRWEIEVRPAPTHQPCVAISRQTGAGGTELAQRIARRFGYSLFDREVVKEVAESAGVSARLVEGLDGHVRSAIERYMTDAFHGGRFTESDYLRHLVRVIMALGERGGVVLLGRGSPIILRPERALRLLVVAPLDTRVGHLAGARSISREEASSIVKRADAERSEFLRHHFGVIQSDATLYDLSINLGTLSLEAAEKLVGEALRDRFPRSTPAQDSRKGQA
jgi:cytidylate kinase